jgi:prepilin-type N-terminal cleavage/methylation domain-containing protein
VKSLRTANSAIRPSNGFTLIELLVVITIIVVLAALSTVGVGMFM